MDKKYKIWKPETQGEWKLSPHLENFQIIPKNIPCCSEWISWSHRACGIFMGENWLRYTNFHFSVLQLSVLVNTKKKENGSSSINMKNYHNIFLPSWRVWISLSHRAFDIFLRVNIGWYILIYIYRDSNSMSWWSQNNRKMALNP